MDVDPLTCGSYIASALAAGRTKKLLYETNMGSSIYSTPVPANGNMFVVNRNQLIAVGKK